MPRPARGGLGPGATRWTRTAARCLAVLVSSHPTAPQEPHQAHGEAGHGHTTPVLLVASSSYQGMGNTGWALGVWQCWHRRRPPSRSLLRTHWAILGYPWSRATCGSPQHWLGQGPAPPRLLQALGSLPMSLPTQGCQASAAGTCSRVTCPLSVHCKVPSHCHRARCGQSWAARPFPVPKAHLTVGTHTLCLPRRANSSGTLCLEAPGAVASKEISPRDGYKAYLQR